MDGDLEIDGCAVVGAKRETWTDSWKVNLMAPRQASIQRR